MCVCDAHRSIISKLSFLVMQLCTHLLESLGVENNWVDDCTVCSFQDSVGYKGWVQDCSAGAQTEVLTQTVEK